MPKVKGPDMMELEAQSLRDSAWLPTSQILECYNFFEIFGNDHPVELELGSGDGGFILGRAKQYPERNFLAVERLLGRSRKIANRIMREGYDNLKVLRLESSYVVERLCPKHSLDLIHIMFPDPWPKKRHHKRRLIQPQFLTMMRQALIPGGTVRFSTDHSEYFEWATEIWNAAPEWNDIDLWNYESDSITEFQQQWEAQGKPTYRTHRMSI
ncbi:MAG: tRNA (guanosine(46)-N7)-methyltransferase TrmB [Verrucomicrobiota bacterium]